MNGPPVLEFRGDEAPPNTPTPVEVQVCPPSIDFRNPIAVIGIAREIFFASAGIDRWRICGGVECQ